MVDDFWEKNAENWDQVIRSQSIASRAVTNAAIVSAIEAARPKTVIDLGCGEGWLTAELRTRGMVCWGVDGSTSH